MAALMACNRWACPTLKRRIAQRIKVIRAGIGNTVRMIPVADVICFEATEKYVSVVTAAGEALVRMSLREPMARNRSTHPGALQRRYGQFERHRERDPR